MQNEFEDNINQYFGGADPEGSGPQQKPPPRDSLIVQPTAGKWRPLQQPELHMAQQSLPVARRI